jgi:hypothetical protein
MAFGREELEPVVFVERLRILVLGLVMMAKEATRREASSARVRAARSSLPPSRWPWYSRSTANLTIKVAGYTPCLATRCVNADGRSPRSIATALNVYRHSHPLTRKGASFSPLLVFARSFFRRFSAFWVSRQTRPS